MNIKRFAFIFFALIFVSSSVIAQNSRDTKWLSDLELFHKTLESKHIDLYNKINKQDFETALENISRNINILSDWQITTELMRLTRLIGDGHTAVSFANWDSHSFPIAVKKISNNWRIIKVETDKNEILGATITSIDGVPVADIEKKLSGVIQYAENSYSEVVRIGDYMVDSELLNAIGITRKTTEAEFSLLNNEGENINLILNSQPADQSINQSFDVLNIGTPAIVKPVAADFEYLWYTDIKGTNATYIRFDSYPSFEDMLSFVEKILQFIAQHQSKQLVIDLRYNGGGDLYIGLVLANALNLIDEINWKNGVYVLTSGVTFSAGASNAALFRQLLNAKIVGSPTGSNPTGYQDLGYFILPNSNLRVTYSKRLFRLQEIVSDGVQPDVFIEQDWVSYVKGIDVVLNEVIKMLDNN